MGSGFGRSPSFVLISAGLASACSGQGCRIGPRCLAVRHHYLSATHTVRLCIGRRRLNPEPQVHRITLRLVDGYLATRHRPGGRHAADSSWSGARGGVGLLASTVPDPVATSGLVCAQVPTRSSGDALACRRGRQSNPPSRQDALWPDLDSSPTLRVAHVLNELCHPREPLGLNRRFDWTALSSRPNAQPLFSTSRS